MSDYYFKHKAELNYRKKLLYNIRKYPFIKSEDDAEYMKVVENHLKKQQL